MTAGTTRTREIAAVVRDGTAVEPAARREAVEAAAPREAAEAAATREAAGAREAIPMERVILESDWYPYFLIFQATELPSILFYPHRSL
ncbi:hypothetical protein D3C87_1636390 [compost metagenome]